MGVNLPVEIENLANLGWYLYPMSPFSKAGAFKGAAESATYDLDKLEHWARQFPGCGWRVVCGPSGLFVLDVDRPGTHSSDGFAALAALVEKHGALPARPMTRTGGSGGAALFFRHDGQPLRGQSGNPTPGLDPHRGRQAVVVPPSRHPVTGGTYTWRVPPWELTPPPIPDWLATLLKPLPEPEWKRQPYVPTSERARNAIMRAIHAVQDAPKGQANDTLNKQAFRLGAWCGAGLLSEAEAVDTLYAAARARRVPHHEARATIRSGFKAGVRQPVQARDGR